jgi:hypothetical protein
LGKVREVENKVEDNQKILKENKRDLDLIESDLRRI